MQRIVTRGVWGLLVVVLASCASPQTAFLRDATGYETQSAVLQRLGQPDEVWPLADGETLWSYRLDRRPWAYWDGTQARGTPGGLTVSGPGLVLLPGERCTEYVLRFDRDQRLRAWNRHACRGFEAGPTTVPLARP